MLVNPVLFESDFAASKVAHLNRDKNNILKQSNKSVTSKQQLEYIHRKSAIFRGTAPYFSLRALKVDSQLSAKLGVAQGLHTDRSVIRRILEGAWAPIFRSGKINIHTLRDIIKLYTMNVSFDWSLACTPSLASAIGFLKATKNSAPGVDGIPFAACHLQR